MVSAYHRRANVDPLDMYADALVTMAAAQDLGEKWERALCLMCLCDS